MYSQHNQLLLVRILGPVSVCSQTLGGKLAAVLTTLVLHANRPVGLDTLIDAVWDTEPPRSAVANLRTYVRTLRGLFGGGTVVLDSHLGGYLLQLAPHQCDYPTFGVLLARGRTALAGGEALAALEPLESALEVWRGDSAAQGVPRHGWLAGRLAAVDEERMRAVESLAEARIAAGEARLAARELTVLLASSPLRGRAWQLKLHAHHRLGEHDAVLNSFQVAARVYREELGLAPDPDLTRLFRSLLSWDSPSWDASSWDLP